MSEQAKNSTTEVLKQSVLTIQNLRRQLEQTRKAAHEPIAVVGLACRFPGGCDTPEAFWDFLCEAGVGVRDVPGDRWPVQDHYDPTPGKPGKMYVRQSNFLENDVASFDARFFKISPLEANAMDPQQRQLLEVCWEALENAGQHPERLRGSSTGVFIGISSNSEYAQLVRDFADVNEYIGTGTTSSIASGRVSYAFGWNGPALSVDTACSSSLVGPHLAVEALRRGECDTALAGGVNMMLSPGVMSSLCMMNALAPDGRSKAFDAAADGYGRGEGVGMVVLKRLSDAERDGDTVYALIRGGAVNNDGESSGLTMPNGRAQRAVLTRALENAGVAPEDVDYLETHGTGTLLGDPIEIDAIHQVYGHESRRLTLGAVKANIGHLEAGAGIASLIKTVLCLHHGQIPPIAGLTELNPRIKPLSGSFDFPDATRAWPARPDRVRHAAISSFGFSGTNAHLVLSEAAQPDAAQAPQRPALDSSLLTLSATDEEKLVRQIRRFDAYLAQRPELPVEDLCYTANATRTAFTHRAVFLGSTAAELREGLRSALAAYEQDQSLYSDTSVILGSSQGRDRWNAKRTLFTTHAEGRAYAAQTDEKIQPKLAFLFHGERGRTFGAARELAAAFPVFREALAEALAHFEDAVGPQLDALTGTGPEPTGPAAEACLFAAEYAQCRLLASYGVLPEITFGERTGSLVAAVVSGVLSLDAAVRHHLALETARRSGEPVAFARVLLAREAFEGVLRDWQGSAHLSAVYGPGERVISGAPAALKQVTEALAAAGAEVTEEPDATWPSAAYQDRAAAWQRTVGGETYQRPGSRYQSPHTLQTSHNPEALRTDFHDNALTSPIRYEEGLRELYDQGYRFFVELGAPRAAEVLEREDVVVLRPVEDGAALDSLLRTLARLSCLGSALSWQQHYADQGRHKLMLPNYPFEPTRHWLANSAQDTGEDQGPRLGGRLSRDGLRGEELNLPVRQKQYLYTFAHQNFPELVDNSGVVHVGYYLEMLRAVLAERYPGRLTRIRDMRFTAALMVFAEETKEVLLVLDPREDGEFDFQFHSKGVDAAQWTVNVHGIVGPAEDTALAGAPLDVAAAKGGRHVAREDFYHPLETDRGFYFGPAVRYINGAWWSGDTEVLVDFAAPEGETAERAYALGFHPGYLDSCAQTCNYVAVERTPSGRKYMVAELDEVVIGPRTGSADLFAAVAMPEFDEGRQEITGSIRLVDAAGATVVRVGHIRLKEFDEKKLGELKAMMDAATLEKDGEDRDFLQRYGFAGAERKQQMVLEYLGRLLAHILEMEPDEVDPDMAMSDFGLDSMTGLRFFHKTGTLLSVDISFADMIQSGTLRDLADNLLDLLPGGTGTQREAQTKPYDSDLSPEHWIYRYEPKPDAKVRLFCFPNGYRDADLFDDWRDQLGPEIDVCAVMLPGMDTKRLDERAPTDIDAFMRTMEEVVDPELLDLPCATFGHSWGALFSFRLSHRLGVNPDANLVKTFVSGFAAPSGPNPSIQDILDELSKNGIKRIPTYEEIRHDSEALEVVVRAYGDAWSYGEVETRATLPQLLAACSLIDRYSYDPKETFAAPVTAFHGVDDWVASEEAKQWEGLTTGPFQLHTMAGDHQFIDAHQSQGRLLAIIRQELMKAVGES